MAYDKVKAHEYYMKYRKRGLKKGRKRAKRQVENPTGNNTLDDRVWKYLNRPEGVQSKEELKKRKKLQKAYQQVIKKRKAIIQQQEKQAPERTERCITKFHRDGIQFTLKRRKNKNKGIL